MLSADDRKQERLMDIKTWWRSFDPISQYIFACMGAGAIALGIGALVGKVTSGMVLFTVVAAVVLGVFGGIISIAAEEKN
jgi:uncharacterized membrane protein YeiH